MYYTDITNGRQVPFAGPDLQYMRQPDGTLVAVPSPISSSSSSSTTLAQTGSPYNRPKFNLVPVLAGSGYGITNAFAVVPVEQQVPLLGSSPLNGQSSSYGNVVQAPNFKPAHYDDDHLSAVEVGRDGVRREATLATVNVPADQSGGDYHGQVTVVGDRAVPTPLPALLEPNPNFFYTKPIEAPKLPRYVATAAVEGAVNFSSDEGLFSHGSRRGPMWSAGPADMGGSILDPYF